MLASLALCSAAHAWTPSDSTFAWQADPLDHALTLDVDSFPADLGPADDIEAAFVDGLDEWAEADAHLRLSYGGRATGATRADGQLTARFADDVAVGLQVATATTWTLGNGHSFDCDIVFFADNALGELAWTLEEGGPGFDLAEVTTHEVGHCLGLDHSDVAGAAMTEHVRDQRGLTDDDEDGVQALFGLPCEDSDGDGVDACRDCDDDDPLTWPGAPESCDGVDRDCDGRVDASGHVVSEFGGTGTDQLRTSWGNVATAEADTVLHHVAQWLTLDDDARVTWSLLHDQGTQWVRVRTVTEVVPAGTGWAESPALAMPLDAGETYAVVVAAHGGAAFAHGPPGVVDGPLIPHGAVSTAFVPADDIPASDLVADASIHPHQRWTVTDPEGTDLCGGGGASGSSSGSSGGRTDPMADPSEPGDSGCGCGGAQAVGAPFALTLGLGGLLGWRRRRPVRAP